MDFENKCYKFIILPTSYEKAGQDCAVSRGAHNFVYCNYTGLVVGQVSHYLVTRGI